MKISPIALFAAVAAPEPGLSHEVPVSTKAECEAAAGFWYGGVCWDGGLNDGLAAGDVASRVAADLAAVLAARVRIDDDRFRIDGHYFEQTDDGMLAIYSFGPEASPHSAIIVLSEDNPSAGYVAGDLAATIAAGGDISGPLSQLIAKGPVDTKETDGAVEVSGNLQRMSGGEPVSFGATISDAMLGIGTTELQIDGDEARLDGTLGSISYAQISDMLRNHPGVTTLVLGTVPGSMNDSVNMHTGRLVREAGLRTRLVADSEIASGGVDLFSAGIERIVERGAKIGVHSWCCIDGKTAIELPENHPGHRHQLAYFTMTLGDEAGPAFYRYTLGAAPFADVHWMSEEDLLAYGLATRIVGE